MIRAPDRDQDVGALAGARGKHAHLALLGYRAASLLHWKPREAAIARAFALLAAHPEVRVERVIDFGCGHGPLAATARRFGWAYVGIEADVAAVAYCQHHRLAPEVAFWLGGIELIDQVVGPHDLVVLSGTAHHLDDEQFASTLQGARSAAALLISDHWRVQGGIAWHVRLLQNLDRGKFVRDYPVLENMARFTLIKSCVFPIRVLGVCLWTYFCNLYLAKQSL